MTRAYVPVKMLFCSHINQTATFGNITNATLQVTYNLF